jgi:hypothetical protein
MREIGLIDPDTDPATGIAGTGPVDSAALRRVLYERIMPSAEYQSIVRSPQVVDWFRWFLGEEVTLHRRQILRNVRPGETGIGTATQAHYDLVYLREGTDRVLSMWIPLGDCPTTRGGLCYLERSHHRVLEWEREGTLPTPVASITADLPGLAEQHDERWLIADYLAGDVVVHSAHLVHASLDNVDADGIIRLSTDIRYQRTSEPIDWRWEHEESDAAMLNFFQFVVDEGERRNIKCAMLEILEGRRGSLSPDESFEDLLMLISDPGERERVRIALETEYGRIARE